jgi:hypothetical protein
MALLVIALTSMWADRPLIFLYEESQRQLLKNLRPRASSISGISKTTNPARVRARSDSAGAIVCEMGRRASYGESAERFKGNTRRTEPPKAATSTQPNSDGETHYPEFGRQANFRSSLVRGYAVIFGTPPSAPRRKSIHRGWLRARLSGAVRFDAQDGYGVRHTLRESTRLQSSRACAEPIDRRENKNH